ncbi:TetR family transcriptional regulator [Sphaerochaeta halotolerans]|uniref:TetR family transcriptional regulator n=2 Tax=Sphaerochaeta halotolerans TaxID=2293840 RepID=A0A372MDC6_9SPIR|nr:TetR family transcriptional regulator [Sphaerochaeta halotolerans]
MTYLKETVKICTCLFLLTFFPVAYHILYMSNSQITKRAIAAALKQQMEHTPLEKITITDICDDCNLNRKSFYYHFLNKYELVIWIFEEEIGKPIRQNVASNSVSLSLAIELCEALAIERSFYAGALSVTGSGSFREYLAHQMQPMILRSLSMEQGSSLDLDETTYLVSEFFLSSLYRWLERTPPTSAETFLESFCSASLALTKRIQNLLDRPTD